MLPVDAEVEALCKHHLPARMSNWKLNFYIIHYYICSYYLVPCS